MGDAFSVPFILSWLEALTESPELTVKLKLFLITSNWISEIQQCFWSTQQPYGRIQYFKSQLLKTLSMSNQLRLVQFRQFNSHSCSWQPIAVGGAFIERVSCFKLLGVYISEDLSWVPIATRLSRGPTGDCMLSECLRIVACQCKIS